MDYMSIDSSTQAASSAALAHNVEWQQQQLQVPVILADTGLEETMQRMSVQWDEGVEVAYPERIGELDCPYYMRTGLCGFGANCKFNHPPSRRLVMQSRARGEYPERPGQPECQYYIKTGTCKFGSSCKYHHPRDRAATAGRPQLNALNLPLRPGEKDCAYYLRTGHCKFGATCKFNHPAPISMPSSAMFPGAPSSSISIPQLYPTGVPAWPMSSSLYVPSPSLGTPPNYTPVLVPPAQVQVPQWNPYSVPYAIPEGQQALPGNYMYGAPVPPQESIAVGLLSPSFAPSLASTGLTMALSPLVSAPTEEPYPERPGEPECQFYMRTGECKYGSQCRYHHPKHRETSSSTTYYSPAGLPLRPGAPPCTFYSRFGYCRFGANCKFDHSFIPTIHSQVGTSDIPMSPEYTSIGMLSTSLMHVSPPEVPLHAYYGRILSTHQMVGEAEVVSVAASLPQLDLQQSSSV